MHPIAAGGAARSIVAVGLADRDSSIPQRVNRVASDRRIARDQGQALVAGMRDQKPIERIAVDERQSSPKFALGISAIG